ncbi:uncharacterized protein FFNC_15335 [Fusarium fujikuroi]|nr:uncharacterized protein FFNC_15335 [Fusarium fujikuroi]
MATLHGEWFRTYRCGIP